MSERGALWAKMESPSHGRQNTKLNFKIYVKIFAGEGILHVKQSLL